MGSWKVRCRSVHAVSSQVSGLPKLCSGRSIHRAPPPLQVASRWLGATTRLPAEASASSGSATGWRSHEATGRDDNRLRLRRRLVGLPNHHVEPREDESLSSAARPTPPKRTTLIAVDVKCPVLALYGGADQSIPQELVESKRSVSGPV